MMGRDESWWQSRTGLEQKLVILSTVLFILSFSLTISVIVINNRAPSGGTDSTTIAPTEVTSGVTGSDETPVTEPSETPATEPSETPATESSTEKEPSSSAATSAETSTETSVVTESTADTSITTESIPIPNAKKQVEASGPGSINSRPARYIPLPRGLANLDGGVLVSRA